MIPHHQNAVNMAKTLLKLGNLQCDDVTDESTDCIMENMMRDTINTQNHQIQMMRQILDTLGLPPEDDCVVNVTSSSNDTTVAPTSSALHPAGRVKILLVGLTAACCALASAATVGW
jgi:hypothetical protein